MTTLQGKIAICVVSLLVLPFAFAAPSVRRTGTVSTSATTAGSMANRAGTLRTVQKPVATTASATGASEGARMATVGVAGGMAALNKKTISNNSVPYAALESLRQEVAALRAEQNQLPTAQWIEEKLTDYTTKSDFEGVQFAVREGNVEYSMDDGTTWETLAPVSIFSGEAGCSPTIVTNTDATNRRVVMAINNCDEYTDIVYIPFGQDGTPGRDGAPGQNGAPGQDGAPGKDACTPSFSATKTNGVTSIKYSCGEEVVNIPLADIADGQSAELTVQDVTRFNLVTADNISDYGILTSDNVSATTTIVTLSNRVSELENSGLDDEVNAIKSVLSKVSNDWEDLGGGTLNMLK